MSYVHFKMNDIAIYEVPYHAKRATRTNKVLFVYLKVTGQFVPNI